MIDFKIMLEDHRRRVAAGLPSRGSEIAAELDEKDRQMAAMKQRRVAAEDVRQNLKESGGEGIASLLKLPEGVRVWAPKKADTYKIDFLPYVRSTPYHPDNKNGRLDLEDGYEILWWKYPFQVHRNIGAKNEMVISPLTINKPDPIWEERQRLAQNYEANKKLVKACTPQKWMAFPIIDPEDSEKVAIFTMSEGKFWWDSIKNTGLKTELEAGDDSNISFYDVVNGKTLKVRFGDAAFTDDTGTSRKFLAASRIDFVDREDMDWDEWRDKIPPLDEMFDIMAYDKLKALFLQTDVDNEDGGGETKEEGPEEKPKTSSAKKSTTTPAKTPDKKPEAKDDAPTISFKVGDKVNFKSEAGLIITGKVVDVDGKIISIKGPDGKEHDVNVKNVQPIGAKPLTGEKPKKEKEPEKEPEEKESEGGEIEVGSIVTFLNKAKEEVTGTVTAIDSGDYEIKDDDGKEYVKELDDLTLVEPTEPDTDNDTPPEFELGDRVKDEDGTEGVIIKMNKESATVKTTDGNILVDFANLMKLEDETEAPNSKSFNVGDKVTWDKGTEEGTVMKLNISDPDEPKAKVKDDTGTLLWKEFAELEPAPIKGKKK